MHRESDTRPPTIRTLEIRNIRIETQERPPPTRPTFEIPTYLVEHQTPPRPIAQFGDAKLPNRDSDIPPPARQKLEMRTFQIAHTTGPPPRVATKYSLLRPKFVNPKYFVSVWEGGWIARRGGLAVQKKTWASGEVVESLSRPSPCVGEWRSQGKHPEPPTPRAGRSPQSPTHQ